MDTWGNKPGGPVHIYGHTVQILIDGKDASHLIMDAALKTDGTDGVTLQPVINMNPVLYGSYEIPLYKLWYDEYYGKAKGKATVAPGEHILSSYAAADIKASSALFMQEVETESEKCERIAQKMVEKQKAKQEEKENW